MRASFGQVWGPLLPTVSGLALIANQSRPLANSYAQSHTQATRKSHARPRKLEMPMWANSQAYKGIPITSPPCHAWRSPVTQGHPLQTITPEPLLPMIWESLETIQKYMCVIHDCAVDHYFYSLCRWDFCKWWFPRGPLCGRGWFLTAWTVNSLWTVIFAVDR